MAKSPWLILIIVGIFAGVGYYLFHTYRPSAVRSINVRAWMQDPQAHPDWSIHAGERCGDAPFLLPTDGFIGYLWDDSFKLGHRHQGIDIFGGLDVNDTPVVAAYPGYLSRLPDWHSTVIVRVPSDPLNLGTQIWVYYTHMADKDGNSFISEQFPPGTTEMYIEAGTFLGRQGNYSGDPNNPVGTHLHFSIVKDNGSGKFLNELEIKNTLDPSPYLGLNVNADLYDGSIIVCDTGESNE